MIAIPPLVEPLGYRACRLSTPQHRRQLQHQPFRHTRSSVLRLRTNTNTRANNSTLQSVDAITSLPWAQRLDTGDLDLLRTLFTSPPVTGHLQHKPSPQAHSNAAPNNWELELKKPFTSSAHRLIYLQELVCDAIKTQDSGLPSSAALARLPPVVFSELLRSLDPVTLFGREIDAAWGIRVSPGMAQHTPLGQLVDTWGVRKVYYLLCRRAVAAAHLRITAGPGLLPSDFQVLLRCAGASSDSYQAGAVWHLMDMSGQAEERTSEAYTEFIKARFLTDHLYTQYDLARFRVRPVDLCGPGRKKLELPSGALYRLRTIGQHRLGLQRHRFGQNRYAADKAEHVMRNMANHRPVTRLYEVTTNGAYMVDERLLCSLMVAYARSGSLKILETRILNRYWSIKVNRLSTGEVAIGPGARPFPRDSPLYPSERLLNAIVTSYGSNSEIPAALKLVDFVSQRYGIPVSDRVWFNLLEWAYIQASTPASTEWKATGYAQKVLRMGSVQLIWNTMTAEPYNVRPGFFQYHILIKSMIRQGRLRPAVECMLKIEPSYRRLVAEHEKAFYKHTLTSALGLKKEATARNDWLESNARKHAAWYTLQVMSRALLQQIKTPSKRNDHNFTIRLVPQFIDAFRDVMPANIKYRVATGVVELRFAQPVRRLRWVEAEFLSPALVSGDVTPSKRRLVGRWKRSKQTVHSHDYIQSRRRLVKFSRPIARRLDMERFWKKRSISADDWQHEFM
ncbi:mitochondrial ATPase expression-domain-containing protein [Lasiosphaeria hispida]|uniref:Mitochondrial ATPase expression-domain-containing protein n=1 Tax=Lasiosphaeria hispida TaxID=260671 RepID=A0AAJ0M7T6_9PEZI|nr:mitochondrial ATPase expression-domain-containing protein [Lasiosphaeria hispida]